MENGFVPVTETLVTTPDEDLTTDELRKRWMFQLPSSNFYMMAFIAIIVGLVMLCMGKVLTGLITLGSAASTAFIILWWQRWRVSTKTREQLLESIAHMRDVHSDMDM